MSGALLPRGAILPPAPRSPSDVLRWAADLLRAIAKAYADLVDRSEEMIQADTFARMPTAKGRRRFFYATDTTTLYYDNGTWTAITGGGGSGLDHPNVMRRMLKA